MADKVHIWSPLDLAVSLRDDDLSDKTVLKHFIIFTLFFSLIASLPIGPTLPDAPAEALAMALIEFLPYAVIVYYGTWYVYQINAKGDARSFFRRFFALTLPVSIRLLLIGTACLAVLALLSLIIDQLFDTLSADEISSSRLRLVGGYIWPIAYYYLMGRYMRVASGAVT